MRDRACKTYAEGKTRPPAAKKVREYAAARGHDLSEHRAETLTLADVEWAGVILFMDERNERYLGRAAGALAKGRCLAEYVGQPKIPDPAYVPRGKELERLLGMVVRACEAFASAYEKAPVG